MTDYIKRDKRQRTFIEIADDLNDLVTELNDKIVESIREENADAVPVVRCKDCRHWSEMQNSAGACLRHSVIDGSWWTGTDSTDYCSFAERRENEIDRR